MEGENLFDIHTFDFTSTILSCSACEEKEKELASIKSDLTRCNDNFKILKQKIIATDQLLRQYNLKLKECKQHESESAEWLKKYGDMQQQAQGLQEQLNHTLSGIEPLKQEKLKLEQQIKKQEQEKEELQNKINQLEFLNAQFEVRIAELEEKRNEKVEGTAEEKKKQTKAENRLKQQTKKIEKLNDEMKVLRVDNTKLQRSNQRLEMRFKKTEEKLLKHLTILVENGLMTEKAKNKVLAATNRLDKINDDEIGSDFDFDTYESDFSLTSGDDDKKEKEKKKKVEELQGVSDLAVNVTATSADTLTKTSMARVPDSTSSTRLINARNLEAKPSKRGRKPRKIHTEPKWPGKVNEVTDILAKLMEITADRLPLVLSPLPASPVRLKRRDGSLDDEGSLSAVGDDGDAYTSDSPFNYSNHSDFHKDDSDSESEINKLAQSSVTGADIPVFEKLQHHVKNSGIPAESYSVNVNCTTLLDEIDNSCVSAKGGSFSICHPEAGSLNDSIKRTLSQAHLPQVNVKVDASCVLSELKKFTSSHLEAETRTVGSMSIVPRVHITQISDKGDAPFIPLLTAEGSDEKAEPKIAAGEMIKAAELSLCSDENGKVQSLHSPQSAVSEKAGKLRHKQSACLPVVQQLAVSSETVDHEQHVPETRAAGHQAAKVATPFHLLPADPLQVQIPQETVVRISASENAATSLAPVPEAVARDIKELGDSLAGRTVDLLKIVESTASFDVKLTVPSLGAVSGKKVGKSEPVPDYLCDDVLIPPETSGVSTSNTDPACAAKFDSFGIPSLSSEEQNHKKLYLKGSIFSDGLLSDLKTLSETCDKEQTALDSTLETSIKSDPILENEVGELPSFNILINGVEELPSFSSLAMLDDFLFEPDAEDILASSPKSVAKVRSRTSSEKENSSPVIQISPNKQQLSLSDKRLKSPVCVQKMELEPVTDFKRGDCVGAISTASDTDLCSNTACEEMHGSSPYSLENARLKDTAKFVANCNEKRALVKTKTAVNQPKVCEIAESCVKIKNVSDGNGMNPLSVKPASGGRTGMTVRKTSATLVNAQRTVSACSVIENGVSQSSMLETAIVKTKTTEKVSSPSGAREDSASSLTRSGKCAIETATRGRKQTFEKPATEATISMGSRLSSSDESGSDLDTSDLTFSEDDDDKLTTAVVMGRGRGRGRGRGTSKNHGTGRGERCSKRRSDIDLFKKVRQDNVKTEDKMDLSKTKSENGVSQSTMLEMAVVKTKITENMKISSLSDAREDNASQLTRSGKCATETAKRGKNQTLEKPSIEATFPVGSCLSASDESGSDLDTSVWTFFKDKDDDKLTTAVGRGRGKGRGRGTSKNRGTGRGGQCSKRRSDIDLFNKVRQNNAKIKDETDLTKNVKYNRLKSKEHQDISGSSCNIRKERSLKSAQSHTDSDNSRSNAGSLSRATHQLRVEADKSSHSHSEHVNNALCGRSLVDVEHAKPIINSAVERLGQGETTVVELAASTVMLTQSSFDNHAQVKSHSDRSAGNKTKKCSVSQVNIHISKNCFSQIKEKVEADVSTCFGSPVVKKIPFIFESDSSDSENSVGDQLKAPKTLNCVLLATAASASTERHKISHQNSARQKSKEFSHIESCDSDSDDLIVKRLGGRSYSDIRKKQVRTLKDPVDSPVIGVAAKTVSQKGSDKMQCSVSKSAKDHTHKIKADQGEGVDKELQQAQNKSNLLSSSGLSESVAPLSARTMNAEANLREKSAGSISEPLCLSEPRQLPATLVTRRSVEEASAERRHISGVNKRERANSRGCLATSLEDMNDGSAAVSGNVSEKVSVVVSNCDSLCSVKCDQNNDYKINLPNALTFIGSCVKSKSDLLGLDISSDSENEIAEKTQEPIDNQAQSMDEVSSDTVLTEGSVEKQTQLENELSMGGVVTIGTKSEIKSDRTDDSNTDLCSLFINISQEPSAARDSLLPICPFEQNSGNRTGRNDILSTEQSLPCQHAEPLDASQNRLRPPEDLCLSEIEADCDEQDTPEHCDVIRPEAVFVSPTHEPGELARDMPSHCLVSSLKDPTDPITSHCETYSSLCSGSSVPSRHLDELNITENHVKFLYEKEGIVKVDLSSTVGKKNDRKCDESTYCDGRFSPNKDSVLQGDSSLSELADLTAVQSTSPLFTSILQPHLPSAFSPTKACPLKSKDSCLSGVMEKEVDHLLDSDGKQLGMIHASQVSSAEEKRKAKMASVSNNKLEVLERDMQSEQRAPSRSVAVSTGVILSSVTDKEEESRQSAAYENVNTCPVTLSEQGNEKSLEESNDMTNLVSECEKSLKGCAGTVYNRGMSETMKPTDCLSETISVSQEPVEELPDKAAEKQNAWLLQCADLLSKCQEMCAPCCVPAVSPLSVSPVPCKKRRLLPKLSSLLNVGTGLPPSFVPAPGAVSLTSSAPASARHGASSLPSMPATLQMGVKQRQSSVAVTVAPKPVNVTVLSLGLQKPTTSSNVVNAAATITITTTTTEGCSLKQKKKRKKKQKKRKRKEMLNVEKEKAAEEQALKTLMSSATLYAASQTSSQTTGTSNQETGKIFTGQKKEEASRPLNPIEKAKMEMRRRQEAADSTRKAHTSTFSSAPVFKPSGSSTDSASQPKVVSSAQKLVRSSSGTQDIRSENSVPKPAVAQQAVEQRPGFKLKDPAAAPSRPDPTAVLSRPDLAAAPFRPDAAAAPSRLDPAPAGGRKRKAVEGLLLETQPKPSASVKGHKRKAVEPCIARKFNRFSSTAVEGKSEKTTQQIEDMVDNYYNEAITVEDVILGLRQITSPRQCGIPVAENVIRLLKLEDTDLQPDIVKDCGTSRVSGAKMEKLAGKMFMSSTEIRFMHLLLRLMEIDPAYERVSLMQTLWTAIFSQNEGEEKTSITQRASLCRLFVGLCGGEGRVEEVRVLAFHVIKMNYFSYVTMLLSIAATWPSALTKPEKAVNTGIIVVMEQIVMSHIASHPALAKLGLCFERLCCWSSLAAPCQSDHLMAAHVLALQAAARTPTAETPALLYELTSCLELLCRTGGWQWTVSNFLERALRSAITRWSTQGPEGLAPGYVAALCGVAGKVVTPEMKSNSKLWMQLFHMQCHNLLTGPHRNAEVETACIDMLLKLAPIKPPTVFKVIHDWYRLRSSDPVARSMKDRINALQNVIMSRAPYLMLEKIR